MKKILLLFLLVLFVFPLAAGEKIIFIPGWFTEWINYSRHRKLLQELFPHAELQICKWDSNRMWKNAKTSAAEAVSELTGKIISSPSPEKIILIGHSLGGRIILDSMDDLSAKNIRIKRVILLGTAARPDDKSLALMQKISAEPVINICCPKDNILKLYCQEEKEIPLGFSGIPQPIDNFRQFKMEIPEKSLKIGKITLLSSKTLKIPRQTAAHLAIYYLKTLHDAFNGTLPEYYLDYPALVKIADRGSCTASATSGFRDIENIEDWKLAEHPGKNLYRIISPDGKIFYYTSKNTALANFRELKRRISTSYSR